MTDRELDHLCINTIRFLAIDAVEKANSGHPGAPMGMAPMAYVLWDRFLKHSPSDPDWPDRDRFVLSAGHASALLYGLLHLTGYALSLDDIKGFRQWKSKTPGHPEHGLAPGVEATTGPLGQGFGNGVGMALAERWLAAHFNRPGHKIIDHYTYAIVSDGDLMEGVASEAASLAGTQGLGKLIYLYDDNDISIEGSTDIAFREDVGARFRAYGWQVIGPIDGMDIDQVDAAIRQAQADREHPSLIICRTVIGYGSPNKANTASVHGEPLGKDEVALTRQRLGWPHKEPFTVPDEVLAHCRRAVDRGKEAQEKWLAAMAAYRKAYPEEAARLDEALSGELPEGWDKGLGELFRGEEKPVALRNASGAVLNAVSANLDWLVGGSADLGPSNKTLLDGEGHMSAEEPGGRNIHFGVREHAMGAIANGMALHGGVIPYTGTFLVFSDYMRPAIRLAALMGQRVIFVFTHDSIGLGEDGPTHQPIEQLAGLRAIPNLVVIRPADAHEVVESWRVALERREGPTALALSRHNVPPLARAALASAEGLRRGGYVLWESAPRPEAVLMGTGSELHLALEAGRGLAARGVRVRVVSMPSWELFEAQPKEYRESVLPPDVRARVSVEAGATLGWERFVGSYGVPIGMTRFGASAPAKELFKQFGFTAERVMEEALRLLGDR